MCNLHRLNNTQSEVASFFNDVLPASGSETSSPSASTNHSASSNIAAESYPGYPSLILANNALCAMHWGFPLARTGVKRQPLKPKPVNNTRCEKLTSPFWSASFRERRCLIPVSAYAEAQGEKGAKTRTWISSPSAPMLAIAGIWRMSDEWGKVYSMITAPASSQIQTVHHRMPVILDNGDWRGWLGGGAEEARELCRAWQAPLQITQSDEPWFRGRSKN